MSFNVILWSVALGMTGFAIYVCTPILLTPLLPASKKTAITNAYYGLAQQSYRRATCTDRKHSGIDILSTSFDSELEAEKMSLDGDAGHAEDPHTWMGRLFGKPFGFLYEERNVLVHPMIAEIGREIARRNARSEEWTEITYQSEDGETWSEERLNMHVKLDDKFRLVNLADVKRAILGTGRVRDAELGEELAEKSQQGYNSPNLVQGMSMIFALLAGAGTAWFIWSNTGTGRDSAVQIPVWIGGYAVDMLGVMA